jgi:hemerythrin superfamily protein
MDAIEFLLNEHAKFRALLNEIEHNSDEESKKQLFSDLCQDLTRHEKMEQEVWYPHFRDSDQLDDTVKHLIKEEEEAEEEIEDLDGDLSKEEWNKKFSQFKTDVQHHAKEEEEKLFPQVRRILDDAQLEQIGQQMQEFKLSNS